MPDYRIRDFASLFAIPLGGEAQAQCVEPDEAFGVALVVDRVLLEGDVAEAVEALGRTPADDPNRAFVELEPTVPSTFSWLLSISACSISRSGENQKPLDQLGVPRHQLVLQM